MGPEYWEKEIKPSLNISLSPKHSFLNQMGRQTDCLQQASENLPFSVSGLSAFQSCSQVQLWQFIHSAPGNLSVHWSFQPHHCMGIFVGIFLSWAILLHFLFSFFKHYSLVGGHLLDQMGRVHLFKKKNKSEFPEPIYNKNYPKLLLQMGKLDKQPLGAATSHKVRVTQNLFNRMAVDIAGFFPFQKTN